MLGNQEYLVGTNLVRTVTHGPDGTLEVTDFFPWAGSNEAPPGRLVRIARVLSGHVEVEVEVVPGEGWRPSGVRSSATSSGWGHPAAARARSASAWSEGVAWGQQVVRTGFELVPTASVTLEGRSGSGGGVSQGFLGGTDRPSWVGRRRLEAGEALVVSVDRADDDRHQPLSPDEALRLASQSATAWRSWLAGAAHEGPYEKEVERSLLLLRSLSGFGAPVGAGTTSVPRRVGGQRQSDERYVHWAHAAMATRVLAGCGLAEDAEAAEAWLRRAVEACPLPWPSVSAADGSAAPVSEELGLAGWRRSQPVVVGRGRLPSGADEPEADSAVAPYLDLDVYGDVVAAVSTSKLEPASAATWSLAGRQPRTAAPAQAGPLAGAWPAIAAAADWLADNWARPDTGVWGTTRPAELVASRVQVWLALEHAARLARAANPLDLAAAGWRQTAASLEAWLESQGPAGAGRLLSSGLRRDTSPADWADAALLRLAWQGPWPLPHPVVPATVDRVLERLSNGSFVHRYDQAVDDGVGGDDSPDTLASLWAVKALAALGRWEEAHERMEAVCSVTGPSGLLGEAIDAVGSAAPKPLGNLPAAGAHLALVDAALALSGGPR